MFKHSSRIVQTMMIIAVAAIITLLAAEAKPCPTCREGLAENPQGQSLATGFYYSILFMMSMPFIILTTFGSFAYRAVKRARKEAAAD